MENPPFVISLATADRRVAYDFYRALGLATPGELADDGVPEPLQVEVGGTRIMFVPTGGFGWGLGARPVSPAGTSECILCVPFATAAEVASARPRPAAPSSRRSAITRGATWARSRIPTATCGWRWWSSAPDRRHP
jgi:hypothetical protein